MGALDTSGSVTGAGHGGPGWAHFPIEGPFHPDGGHCAITPAPREALALLEDPVVRSLAVVSEDGVPLVAPTDDHAYIRTTGHGAYSLWGDDLYLSSSDGSDIPGNGRAYVLHVPDPTAARATRRFPLRRPLRHVGGFGWAASLPEPARALLDADPFLRDMAIVTEDDEALPVPTVHHQHVIDLGAGRFSLLEDTVYFSARDGADCEASRREYAVEVPEPGRLRATMAAHERVVVDDEATLLRLVIESSRTNNTVFGNFFSQGAQIRRALAANGMSVGERAVVLGCGLKPWIPLRLLAEGAASVLANDLGPVRAELDDALADAFLEVLGSVEPSMLPALASRRRAGAQGTSVFEGVEGAGGIAFEDLDIPAGSVDLLVSNSVLEHVMRPEAVYAQMARTLRPGGIALHWVDLRDHLAFHDPLRFLTLSAEEYAAIDTENRLRATDHLRLAAEHGLEVRDARFDVIDPEDRSRWGTAESWADVRAVVTEQERAGFHADFHGHSLEDLSIVGLYFLAVRA